MISNGGYISGFLGWLEEQVSYPLILFVEYVVIVHYIAILVDAV